jgi:hypothetical protein
MGYSFVSFDEDLEQSYVAASSRAPSCLGRSCYDSLRGRSVSHPTNIAIKRSSSWCSGPRPELRKAPVSMSATWPPEARLASWRTTPPLRYPRSNTNSHRSDYYRTFAPSSCRRLLLHGQNIMEQSTRFLLCPEAVADGATQAYRWGVSGGMGAASVGVPAPDVFPEIGGVASC